MRCYAPSTSVIVGLLAVGYLALRHAAAHALGGVGLVATAVGVLGGCLLTVAIIVVSAATIRRRRAAAGGCLTCRHPCQESVTARSADQRGPVWPDRPLTRAALPVVIIPRPRPAGDGAEQGARERQPARLSLPRIQPVADDVDRLGNRAMAAPDDVRDQPGPACLVGGAEPGGVVAVKVLAEVDVVAPLRVVL